MGAKSSNCGQPNSPLATKSVAFSSLCFLSIFMLLVVFHQLQYNEEGGDVMANGRYRNSLELFNFK